MKQSVVNYFAVFFLVALFVGCTGTLKPVHTDPATPGLVSKTYSELKELPDPQEKVVAAVYRFRDQTGQYKPSENVASWSTAVTQGATSILIKSMEESGWFIPIEREGISNLLNERQIIQSIRNQNSNSGRPEPLPPLLFAGVLLEGGVIGYDTNVITGGVGARYLGSGASTNYRKDQVTIYLRAISTQSGRVLKTVHTTKSIISQQLESGIFRFVDTNRLIETEAGYTYNEPPVMAVTEAIDEAVKQLIIEGAEEGIWSPQNLEELTAYKNKFEFQKEKEEQLQRDYFGLIEREKRRTGWAVSLNSSLSGYEGNYTDPDIYAGGGLQVERSLTNSFSLKTNFQRTALGARNVFSEPVTSGDLLFNTYFTSQHKISPFLGIGGGVIAYDKKHEFLEQQFFPSVSFEGGLDYLMNDFLGVRLSANYRYLVMDGIDGVSEGNYNDQLWNVNAGLIFRF